MSRGVLELERTGFFVEKGQTVFPILTLGPDALPIELYPLGEADNKESIAV